MKRNALIIGVSFLGIIFAVELILRQLGFQPGFQLGPEKNIIVKPSSLFTRDTELGWSLSKGCYTTFSDSHIVFKHCVENDLSRTIPCNTPIVPFRKSLHLYGCSYTFGYSVSDTSNVAFYLQQKMSDYEIVNKGVPAFGLLQMFLSLQKEVDRNNKPNIAIFNYAQFQDMRTPLCHEWIKQLVNGIAIQGYYETDYPYATIESDNKLVFKIMKWEDIPKYSTLRNNSSIINLVGNYLDSRQYQKILPTLELINYKLAIAITSYCKTHNIKLIFAGMDVRSRQLLDKLQSLGVTTLYYDIDVSQEDNNCAPLDPYHPNAKVHKLYAGKIVDCLIKKGW